MGWRWKPDPSKAYYNFNEGSGSWETPYGWVWVEGVPSEGYTTFNEGTSEYHAPPPDPTGLVVATTSFNEGTQEGTVYRDAGSGLAFADQAAAAAQLAAQQEAEFKAAMTRPGVTFFEQAELIRARYGIEAVAELTKTGQFFSPQQAAELGPWIVMHQDRASSKGFTIGGNALGLWPVLLGVGAFAALGAAGIGTAAGSSTTAATGTTAGAVASTEAVVSGAELAALVEAGTVGAEGAFLEAAALSGSSVAYNTATGAIVSAMTPAGATVAFDPAIDPFTQFGTVPASTPSTPQVPSAVQSAAKALAPGFIRDAVQRLLAPSPAPRAVGAPAEESAGVDWWKLALLGLGAIALVKG